jgi:signal transduction histidine kinase
VDEERLRFAREMHDIVAHSMSLIAVKATIANHVADERPQEMRDALRVIEDTSRAALTELRRTLGALRTDTDVAPVSGMHDLPGLVHTAGSTGLRVELAVTGAAEVPDGAGLAVYRIVQEAITNVVKHAGATSCRVVVVGEPGQVTVEVTDDGSARPDQGATGGQGLIGMRERVALHGGRLEAGPSAGGGWAVRARLDTGP